jgi:TolA-binding protein
VSEHCGKLQAFLDGRIGAKDRRDFEAHLASCGNCTARVSSWRSLEAGLLDWAEARTLPAPGPTQARRLLDRLDSRKKTLRRRWILYPVAAAVATAALVAIIVALPSGEVEEKKTPEVSVIQPEPLHILHSVGAEPVDTRRAEGAILSVPGEGQLVARLAGDRVALAARSRTEVIRAERRSTRLRLHVGRLACSVSPRETEGEFVVEAGRAILRVVGTRFLAAYDTDSGLVVQVSEGVVLVTTESGESHEVAVGWSLERSTLGETTRKPLEPRSVAAIDALLEGKTPGVAAPELPGTDEPPSPRRKPKRPPRRESPTPVPDRGDLVASREQILEGRYREAEAALAKFLETRPESAEAWSLLGDCRRKAGNWKLAIQAYEKVIALGPDSAGANRARYMAATIHQDELGRHAAATRLLQAYLEQARGFRPLEAEAMLRLAISFIELGKQERAGKLLRDVVARHAGTLAAVKARRILKARLQDGGR